MLGASKTKSEWRIRKGSLIPSTITPTGPPLKKKSETIKLKPNLKAEIEKQFEAPVEF